MSTVADYIIQPDTDEMTEILITMTTFNRDEEKKNRIQESMRKSRREYNQRNPRKTLTFTQQEMTAFNKAATDRGLPTGHLIKQLAWIQLRHQNRYIPTLSELQAVQPELTPLPPEQEQIIKKMIKYLKSIAMNINQQTHMAHIHQTPDILNYTAMKKQVDDTVRLIEAFCQGKISLKKKESVSHDHQVVYAQAKPELQTAD